MMMFNAQRILVTGASGSFGKQIVKDLLVMKFGLEGGPEIRLMARNEHRLLDLWDHHARDPRLALWVGDVRDPTRVQEAVDGCDLVFHAAALKHVHFCEFHPEEAALTNIMGARNILNAALHTNSFPRVVAVSTDKAVEPVNVMGMTKAVQERLVASYDQRAKAYWTLHGDRPRFCCVRYGNVIGSQGSIIPKWVEMAKAGKRLPVTDPRMTRFLFQISEATDLVFYAAEHMTGGEIFVRKIPSARMLDVACDVVRTVTGAEPAKDCIEITGVRPGEKIHETLVSLEEMRRTKDCGDYFVVQPHAHVGQTYGTERESTPFCSDQADVISGDRLYRVLADAGVYLGGSS